MINLNDFRKNIYHNYGVKECPHYSEDGVIKKIFYEIGVEGKPFTVEFGETRSLGTTTRAFRIGYLAQAIYFVGHINFYSKILNILDVLKTTLLTRNIKCLKFLMNMPFVYFITPENIVDLFNNLVKKEGITRNSIDLLTIDIDSYDYYCVKELLAHKYKPRVFVVEYNPNLPINEALSYPNLKSPSNIPKNKKIYGASYLAMNNLMKSYGYELVHISGFCNLIYVRNEYSGIFTCPDINVEKPSSKEEIIKFVDLYCQKNFIPSWLNEPHLTDKELNFFEKV